MWNPLDEPTIIPELEAIHANLRSRYVTPSLELYSEYWTMLMGQSVHHAIEFHSLGGKEFAKRMRQWRLQSIPIQGLVQKIQKELYVLHLVYKETVLPCRNVDQLFASVEQFVKHAPTYQRLIPTVLGYPKYKAAYGCCGLGLPSIPASGFPTCLCKTYIDLSKKVDRMMYDTVDRTLLTHIQAMRDVLNMWKAQEHQSAFGQKLITESLQ